MTCVSTNNKASGRLFLCGKQQQASHTVAAHKSAGVYQAISLLASLAT